MMRIGVQLPEVERVVRWPELARMARAAEAAGFDSLWVGDHYLYDAPDGRVGPWEAWTTLAALAAVTERVQLAPFVASLTFHNPAVVAKMAATVDEVSRGRLILGVGAGWNETEYRAFGFPFERRIARFAESFHVVHRLLAGETVTIDGEFVQLDRCVVLPPSARAEPIPILVGSTGQRMLDITLPYAAAWNAWFTEYGNRPADVGRALAPLHAACERIGRDPATVVTSVALLLDLGTDRPRQHSINPVRGAAAQVEALHELAAAGIDLVQLVLDPITEASIGQAADVVAAFRAGSAG